MPRTQIIITDGLAVEGVIKQSISVARDHSHIASPSRVVGSCGTIKAEGDNNKNSQKHGNGREKPVRPDSFPATNSRRASAPTIMSS